MARKPTIEQTDEGVTVSFEGRILPPPLPPLRKKRHCPKCGHGPVSSAQRYATSPTSYCFECPRCVNPETCRPTRWKDPR